MSLNSVVNNLVRAAAGIPSDISDADLDRHVAELLATEAKRKELKWSELGLGVLLGRERDSPDPSLPKPNKRFLSSIIRNVDGHNTALLRAQAQAAREARNERLGESSSSRSSRTGSTGASRLFGGAMKGVGSGRGERTGHREHRQSEISRDRRQRTDWQREDAERKRGEPADDERDRRHRNTRDDRRHRDDSEDRHSRSQDGNRSSRRHAEKDTHRRKDHDDDDDRRTGREERCPRHPDEGHTSTSRYGHSKTNAKSPTSIVPPAQLPPSPPKPDPSPPRLPPETPPPALSKMDKYFEKSYDPRLDYGVIPKEGLIADVGWDNMLAILKDRGKKKREQSPNLSDDGFSALPPLSKTRAFSPDLPFSKTEKKAARAKKEERKKRRAGFDDDSDASEEERERAKRKEKRKKEKEREKHLVSTGLNGGKEREGMFGMEYTRKGGVREWDRGK